MSKTTKMKLKMVILDFSDSVVYIKTYDQDKWDSAEDYLAENGFNESNCQWMVVPLLKIDIE